MPQLDVLQIEGILEFDNEIDHYLSVNVIFINGGQLIVGWEDSPILTNVVITLTGELNSYNFTLPDQLSMIGGKAIGVYGGLDLHGKPRNISWTRLNQTADIGANSISLYESVDWQIGEQIIITTTSFIANQSEVLTITGVSSDRKTIRFNESLQYRHIAFSEHLPNSGQIYQIAAGVGLLSRNIKITGGFYSNQEKDLYGSRIIVSDYSNIVNGMLMYYKGKEINEKYLKVTSSKKYTSVSSCFVKLMSFITQTTNIV